MHFTFVNGHQGDYFCRVIEDCVDPAFTVSAGNKEKQLLNAIGAHEENRKPIAGNKESEIVLFIIDADHQRQGIGKQLWVRFREHCLQAGVTEIFVDANKLDARPYYEGLGFALVQNFDSPLHHMFSESRKASICRWRYG